ncbi:spidroin-1 [Gracilaria domingensis]|nr:spidroin-1 [Gracilaria domingensis]
MRRGAAAAHSAMAQPLHTLVEPHILERLTAARLRRGAAVIERVPTAREVSNFLVALAEHAKPLSVSERLRFSERDATVAFTHVVKDAPPAVAAAHPGHGVKLNLFTVTQDYTNRSALPWTDAAGFVWQTDEETLQGNRIEQAELSVVNDLLRGDPAQMHLLKHHRRALCGVHRRGRHATRRRAQRPHTAAHGPRQGLAEPERLHAPPSHRRGGHAVGRAQPGAARGEQRPRPPADHPRRQQRRASVLPKLAQAHPRAAHAAGRQLVLPAARAPLRLSGRPRALRRRQRRRQQSRALAAATGAAVVPEHPGGPSRRSAFGLDRHQLWNPPPAVRHCVFHIALQLAGAHLSRASASSGARWSGRSRGCRLRHLLRCHGTANVNERNAEKLVKKYKNGPVHERLKAATWTGALAYYNDKCLTFTGLEYTGSADYPGSFTLSELREAGYITTFALDGREMLVTPNENKWMRLKALDSKGRAVFDNDRGAPRILPIEARLQPHEDFSLRGVSKTYGVWTANVKIGSRALLPEGTNNV